MMAFPFQSQCTTIWPFGFGGRLMFNLFAIQTLFLVIAGYKKVASLQKKGKCKKMSSVLLLVKYKNLRLSMRVESLRFF